MASLAHGGSTIRGSDTSSVSSVCGGAVAGGVGGGLLGGCGACVMVGGGVPAAVVVDAGAVVVGCGGVVVVGRGGVVVVAAAVVVGRGGMVVVGHGGVPGVPQGGGTSWVTDAEADIPAQAITTAAAISPAAPATQRRLAGRAGIGWNVGVVTTRLLGAGSSGSRHDRRDGR